MKIELMDKDLYQLLMTGKGFRMSIHSIYDTACNLINSEGLWVTVVSRGRWLPPNGMRIKEFDKNFSDKRPGDEFQIVDNLKDTELRDLNISILQGVAESTEKLKAKLFYLNAYLQHFKGQGIANQDYPESIKKSLSDLEKALNIQNVALLERSLHGLIGYGKGLTPSMDDHLAARILTLKAWENAYSSKKNMDFGERVVKASKARTTIISEQMLGFANIGKCTEEVYNLLQAIFYTSEGRDLDDGIKEVLAMGSTSGEDWLTGILMEGNRLLMKHEGGNKEWD